MLKRPAPSEMTVVACAEPTRETEKCAAANGCHGLHDGPSAATGPGQPNEICVCPARVPFTVPAVPLPAVARTKAAIAIDLSMPNPLSPRLHGTPRSYHRVVPAR